MNLVSEKEFLDLPLVSVAEIVRCRGPKVSVFPFDAHAAGFTSNVIRSTTIISRPPCVNQFVF